MTTPLSGLTWGSGTITWGFAVPGAVPNLGTVTAAISDPAQQAAVTAGVTAWEKVCGVKLVQVAPAQANVQIGYGQPSGLLGECLWFYNPQAYQYINSLIIFGEPSGGFVPNTSGQLTYPGLDTTLQQLATHEFGAALGLAEGDGSDPTSVMNHVQGASNQVPDAADIAAIVGLYGPPVITDTLVVTMAADAWRGDPAFTLMVNGTMVAGTTAVTAAHTSGQTQSFTYSGTWGTAPTVAIAFVNDLYGGAPARDRNLYVEQVAFNGSAVLTTMIPMMTNGTLALALGA